MGDGILRFTFEATVQQPDETFNVLAEQAVNQDIAEFDQFFQGLGNEPLNKFEVAIVKTYCAWKLGLTQEKKDAIP